MKRHESILSCRGLELDLGEPRIMGILNTSPDSFHADSRLASVEAALERARQMVAEGVDVLDVGGQSTRPGYQEVAEAEEIARTASVIRALAAEFPCLPISIDTYKPAVAAAALEAGAHLINDVRGLQGPGGSELARLAAASGAALVVMHNDPALRDAPEGEDPVPRVMDFLIRSLRIAVAAGVAEEQVVVDPGIGFGKTQLQNVAILRRLEALHALGRPVLLGVSRKSVFGFLLPELGTPSDRLEATLAVTALATAKGVRMHRVHDVLANRRVARVAAGLG